MLPLPDGFGQWLAEEESGEFDGFGDGGELVAGGDGGVAETEVVFQPMVVGGETSVGRHGRFRSRTHRFN